MAYNYGKKFEARLKKDLESIPGISIDRIYDVQSGYKTISNISDFIAYKYPIIAYIECKSHKGNTFPLSCLTQYSKLIEKDGIKGVKAGAAIWFSEKDKIVWVPISTFKKLYDDGKKSFHINMIAGDEYECIEIPTKKLRTFLSGDYSVLFIDDTV